MPFPLDGEPIIGRIPQLPHCYVVTGLASSGFGRGPMAGRLLAESIHTGHRPSAGRGRSGALRDAGDRRLGKDSPPRSPATFPRAP